jgi:hypothetical protein
MPRTLSAREARHEARCEQQACIRVGDLLEARQPSPTGKIRKHDLGAGQLALVA